MKYEIKKINRTVELDNELVKVYSECKEIKDSLFTIMIRHQYGNNPTKKDVSDEDLSKLCNECILNELKVWNVLPKLLNYIESHYEEWTDGQMHELPFDEMSI